MRKDRERLADITKINIRLHDYPESMIALKNLKAAYIGILDVKFELAFVIEFINIINLSTINQIN